MARDQKKITYLNSSVVRLKVIYYSFALCALFGGFFGVGFFVGMELAERLPLNVFSYSLTKIENPGSLAL